MSVPAVPSVPFVLSVLTRLSRRVRGPRAEIEGAGLLVPAVALRLAVLLAGGALTALLVAGRAGGWPVLALVALTVGCAWAPGSVLPGVLGLLTLAIQLGEGRLDVRAVATALALYLTCLTCGFAACVPSAGRVELAALVPALRRLAAVTVLTVLVAALAGLARHGGVRAGEQLLLLVGLVLLGGAAVLAVVLWGRTDGSTKN